MRFLKFSSIVIFSFLFMWVCMPELSAGHHRSGKYHYHKHRHNYTSRSSRFAFNLNLNPTPNYYVYPAPVPAYVVAPAPVPVVEQRVYYPYYAPQPIVVQPSFSYWRY